MHDNPWAKLEERMEGQIPTASLQIYQFIDKHFTREKSTHINRASSANMCVKRRWYQGQGVEGTPLTPRKIINFTLGDLSEKVMLFFIKNGLVGDGLLYSEVDFGEVIGTLPIQGKQIEIYAQQDLSFKLPDGTPVTAHADGFGRRNSDGLWELIEIKSAADYGFDSFVSDGPGDYLKQAHALMLTTEAEAKRIKMVRFFYLKKNTGNIYDKLFSFDSELAMEVIEDFMTAKAPKEPKAPYSIIPETFRGKPTGRYTVPWQCGYCSYLRPCKGEYEKEFKNGTPKFIFQKEKIHG